MRFLALLTATFNRAFRWSLMVPLALREYPRVTMQSSLVSGRPSGRTERLTVIRSSSVRQRSMIIVHFCAATGSTPAISRSSSSTLPQAFSPSRA